MQKLREVVANPSGWDSLDNYAGELPEPEWLCLMTRTRDSDLLTESNWDTALAALGGEGDSVTIFRFGHWACGWWEALAVKEGSEEADRAEALSNALADYPVLDEDDLSTRESEEADRVWRDCYDDAQRLAYMRKFRDQFDFLTYGDLIGCVRGRYFAGYASELLY